MNPEGLTALTIVKLGFGEQPYRSLDFRVRVSLVDVPRVLGMIGDYNGFDPLSAAAAVLGAATTDTRCESRIYVGREGSPVIYVRDLDDQDDRHRAAELFLAAGADEVSCTADGELRAWWA